MSDLKPLSDEWFKEFGTSAPKPRRLRMATATKWSTTLKAGHGRLLVKKISDEMQTNSAIHLPSAMREESLAQGVVLSVGATDQKHGEIGAKVGDTVYYHPVTVVNHLGNLKRIPPPTVVDPDGLAMSVLKQGEIWAIQPSDSAA